LPTADLLTASFLPQAGAQRSEARSRKTSRAKLLVHCPNVASLKNDGQCFADCRIF
jgi:hypothetical protein